MTITQAGGTHVFTIAPDNGVTFEKLQEMLHRKFGLAWQRACMPLWGGISNLDARSSLQDLPPDCQIIDFFRFTDVGQLVPLYIAASSLNDEIRLATKYREGRFSSSQIDSLIENLILRLSGGQRSSEEMSRSHDTAQPCCVRS